MTATREQDVASPAGSRWRRLLGLVVMMLSAAVVIGGIVAGPETGGDRADKLAAIIRCPQCQGESIADSSALTARTMRQIVAERVDQGQSDDEILDYFRGLYGDAAIIEPSFGGWNLLLWTLPAAALISGMGLVVWLRDKSAA